MTVIVLGALLPQQQSAVPCPGTSLRSCSGDIVGEDKLPCRRTPQASRVIDPLERDAFSLRGACGLDRIRPNQVYDVSVVQPAGITTLFDNPNSKNFNGEIPDFKIFVSRFCTAFHPQVILTIDGTKFKPVLIQCFSKRKNSLLLVLNTSGRICFRVFVFCLQWLVILVKHRSYNYAPGKVYPSFQTSSSLPPLSSSLSPTPSSLSLSSYSAKCMTLFASLPASTSRTLRRFQPPPRQTPESLGPHHRLALDCRSLRLQCANIS
jgi:hypothetical protein